MLGRGEEDSEEGDTEDEERGEQRHVLRAGALKRRWVEYGRRRLDTNAILSTFEYVAWPEQVRAQYLAPDMYLRVTGDGMRVIGR